MVGDGGRMGGGSGWMRKGNEQRQGGDHKSDNTNLKGAGGFNNRDEMDLVVLREGVVIMITYGREVSGKLRDGTFNLLLNILMKRARCFENGRHCVKWGVVSCWVEVLEGKVASGDGNINRLLLLYCL